MISPSKIPLSCLSISGSSTARYYEATLSGIIAFNEIETQTIISLPSRRLEAFLRPNSVVQFKPLLEYFHLNGTSFDNITLDSLRFEADLSDKLLALQLHVSDVWHIYNFQITGVTLAIAIIGKTADRPSAISGSIQGEFRFGDIPIEILAAYDGASWQFKGAVQSDTLSLYHGIHYLAEKIDSEGIVEILPDVFKDLQIGHIEMAFTPSEKKPAPANPYFSFGFELHDSDGKWELIPGLLTLSKIGMRIELIAGRLFGHIEGTLQIGETGLNASLDFPALRGQANMPDGQEINIAKIFSQFLYRTPEIESFGGRNSTLKSKPLVRATLSQSNPRRNKLLSCRLGRSINERFVSSKETATP